MEAIVASFEVRELLLREYFELQRIVEGYNGQSLTIKGWSVTVAFVALVTAYTQRVPGVGRAGVALAGFSALPFLVLDALWKSFQLAYYPRLCAIEMALSGDLERASEFCRAPATTGPEIFRSWDEAYNANELDLILQALTTWAVLLPHIVVIVGGVVLAVVLPPRPPADTA